MMNNILHPSCLTPLNETHADLTVIMCPHAGVGIGAFRQWRHVTSPALDIAMVTYPGRDHRMDDPLTYDVTALADEVAGALLHAGFKNRRIILAGHSMGAQIAFETCLRLEAAGRSPDLLVLSGCHAPHLAPRTKLSGHDDAKFLELLVAIGGCNDMVKNNPLVLEIFMPMLRADFSATESYGRDDMKRLIQTPTMLMSGEDDQEALVTEVLAWTPWLHSLVRSVTFPGDHFYPMRDPEGFLSHIVAAHADHVAKMEGADHA
ncbi:thioesterase domain-containing protein [Candidatus Kirkpatrickella diaphorinae]|uniref:Thioesterase domain-containing protein n=1 Tax=Candidatus Kirkpatrickella diaphorinae TaxID=2984322 RepID=A0ABY6GKT7_9PROT|nr:alpha/beta fold hydrolase [Candidatus Kirkpatrickella diaphorinae]UYH51621.1 thioesterase domain-containing protein [Candidatus Kirkpatrickella diaphorinae]